VVSYEQPLEYVCRDRFRDVCANGLDASDGNVTWTVPDLKVVVRDDLAVSWGLNRMTAQQGDGAVVESWSRGTRVFQKTDQGWEMVHQHVSLSTRTMSTFTSSDVANPLRIVAVAVAVAVADEQV
jgi:ketosteroid isomerase-like protein